MMKRIAIYLLLIVLFSQSAFFPQEKFKVISQKEGPIKTNCYLLYDISSKEAAIIDPGGPLDSLIFYIRIDGLNLRYIFLTHAHWDHVEGIFDLKDKFPEAKVCLRKEEYLAMQEYTNYAKVSDPERFEKSMQDSALARMIGIDLGSIEPDIYLKDDEEYYLGNLKIRTLFTPGHSAGSMCFSCENVLFTGDVLLYRSVGNTDFYKASRGDQILSVRKLYELFPDSTIVYTGHGQFTNIGSEKKENKYITVDGGKWDIK